MPMSPFLRAANLSANRSWMLPYLKESPKSFFFFQDKQIKGKTCVLWRRLNTDLLINAVGPSSYF